MKSLAILLLFWFTRRRSLTDLPADVLHRGSDNFQKIQFLRDLERVGINLSHVNPRIVEDGFLTAPELIKKYGYPLEVHTVQTPDGYLLEMHRIPKPGAIPVYLQHGIIDSSGAWVIMGPHSGLAYNLADQGYDVWMGNARGNRYSRRHIKLNPEKKDFWDFSFHEIGKFDIPAMIDLIVEKTGYQKIHYVGHSQGTTSFWVMCSERPIYCEKILSVNALAPVAFMAHTKSPLIRALVPFLDQMEILLKMLGIYEFLPSSDLLSMGGQIVCKEQAITQVVCMNTVFLVAGFNSEQLNKTMLPAILGHIPAGSSTKQMVHYGQLIKSKKFRQFDYGWLKNVFKYGSAKPPNYDLSKVKVPVALHHSKNDWLAQPQDVWELEKNLPNVIKSRMVPMPKFNHLDFLFAIKVREMVNDEVIQVITDIQNEVR